MNGAIETVTSTYLDELAVLVWVTLVPLGPTWCLSQITVCLCSRFTIGLPWMAIVCPSRVSNVQRGWWCGWGDIFCHKLWTESKRGTGFGLWPSPPSPWPAPTRLCPHLLGVDLVWWKRIVTALWWTDVLSPGESRVLGQERGGGLLWVEHLGGWDSVFKARCSLGQEIRRATSHRSAIDRTSLKQIEFDKIHQFHYSYGENIHTSAHKIWSG